MARQIRVADLAATSNELTTLHSALRKAVEAQTAVVNAADSSDPAYHRAASDLVELPRIFSAH